MQSVDVFVGRFLAPQRTRLNGPVFASVMLERCAADGKILIVSSVLLGRCDIGSPPADANSLTACGLEPRLAVIDRSAVESVPRGSGTFVKRVMIVAFDTGVSSVMKSRAFASFGARRGTCRGIRRRGQIDLK